MNFGTANRSYWKVSREWGHDHLEWIYDGAFEQLFGLGRGKFEQKFSKNSNAPGLPGGDVEASIWPVHYERDSKAELFKAILKPDAIPSLFSHRPPPKKAVVWETFFGENQTRGKAFVLSAIHTAGLIYDGAVSILCIQASIHSLWGCTIPKYTLRYVDSPGPIMVKRHKIELIKMYLKRVT